MESKVGFCMKNKKWTNELILLEALKYPTRTEFQFGSGSAYMAALRKDILEDACKHMPIYDKIADTNPNFVWTDEALKEEALKYTSKGDFKKNSRGAFEACNRRKILKDLCLHMVPAYSKWTYKTLSEEAKKYGYRSEFETKNMAAYSAALSRKIMDKICKHMKRPSLSTQEGELLGRILSVFSNAKTLRDMKVRIKGKPHIKGFDIDIFVPHLNKGIEFDGTYYHSFEGLRFKRKHWPDNDIKNYHKIKDRWFKSKGILF